MCLWLCTNSIHNTAQNSSGNVPSYLQTVIIAQMLSITGKGGGTAKEWRVCLEDHTEEAAYFISWVPLLMSVLSSILWNDYNLPSNLNNGHQMACVNYVVHSLLLSAFKHSWYDKVASCRSANHGPSPVQKLFMTRNVRTWLAEKQSQAKTLNHYLTHALCRQWCQIISRKKPKNTKISSQIHLSWWPTSGMF